MFPLRRFFSANWRFDGARVNKFWQYSKHTFRKFDKFVETKHLVYRKYPRIGRIFFKEIDLKIKVRLIHRYFFYKKYTQFFHRFRVKYPLRPIHGIVLYAGIYGTLILDWYEIKGA